jgi:hypothetical protein
LPTRAKSLNKSNLKADNCVNIQVARIPFKVELFNGDLAAGPVPILFSSDRAATINGLMEHADTALEDLGKLNSRFYFMEHLSMEEALTYLADPARKAKGKITYHLPPLRTSRRQRSRGSPHNRRLPLQVKNYFSKTVLVLHSKRRDKIK